MKIKLVLISLILVGCSSPDYYVDVVHKEAPNHFFDINGKRWFLENSDMYGHVTNSSKVIENELVPYCFLREKDVKKLVQIGDKYQGEINSIFWYGRIKKLNSKEFILFGEYNSKSIVKINKFLYLNGTDPKFYLENKNCQKERKNRYELIDQTPVGQDHPVYNK